MTGQNNTPPEQEGLKRTLGFWLLFFYGLGNILGAGIYVLVGEVAGEAGYYAPASFLIAALIATFTVLTYSELSSRFPLSAGEALYLHKGFGKAWISLISGILIAGSGMLSCATMLRGFAGYMQVFVSLPDWMLILSVLICLAVVAVWGIGESVKIASLFTLIEIGGLVLIIITGSSELSRLPEINAELPSLGNPGVLSGLFAGAFLAFYAFTGFEDMVNVAEEVKEPEKNMPRAMIFSLIISTILYAMVSLVAIANIPPDVLVKSDAPLADIYESATGRDPVLITVIGLFAVINGALIQIIMASRVFYGMSRQGWIPSLFSKVSKKTRTPVIATIFAALIISQLALFLPIKKLAELTSFLILTMFFLINLALLRVRKKYELPENVRGYPAFVPVLGAIGSLLLFLTQLFNYIKTG